MTLVKKSMLSLALIGSMVTSTSVKALDENGLKRAKSVGWLVGTGLMMKFIQRISANPATQKALGQVHVEPDEAAIVTGLCGSLYSLEGFGLEGSQDMAARVPLVAFVAKVTNTSWWQQVVANIPFVGDQLTAKEGDSPSAQFLKKTLQVVAVYKALDLAIPYVLNKYFQ